MLNRKPSSNLYLLQYAAMGMMLPTFILFNKPSQTSVTEKTPQQSVNLPTPKPQETIPMKLKPVPNNATPQDTAKEEEISFMLIVNPNLDADHQEKIRNEKFPLGKKLELTKNAEGRIIGAKMQNESGGSCYASHEANNDLPIVLYGGRNSCGTGTFDTDVLDKLIANQWPKNMKVMTYGIPNDPLLLEAYRSKILAAKAGKVEEHVKNLASDKTVVSKSSGSTTYGIPVKEDSWNLVKRRIGFAAQEGIPYTIIVNGAIQQSELPNIELSKITKLVVSDEVTVEYIEGTLKAKRYERSGLRVDISLE